MKGAKGWSLFSLININSLLQRIAHKSVISSWQFPQLNQQRVQNSPKFVESSCNFKSKVFGAVVALVKDSVAAGFLGVGSKKKLVFVLEQPLRLSHSHPSSFVCIFSIPRNPTQTNFTGTSQVGLRQPLGHLTVVVLEFSSEGTGLKQR